MSQRIYYLGLLVKLPLYEAKANPNQIYPMWEVRWYRVGNNIMLEGF